MTCPVSAKLDTVWRLPGRLAAAAFPHGMPEFEDERLACLAHGTAIVVLRLPCPTNVGPAAIAPADAGTNPVFTILHGRRNCTKIRR